MVNLKKRKLPITANQSILDINACFISCTNSTEYCSGVTITSSLCAGSEMFGFINDALECSSYSRSIKSFNYAHATMMGFMISNQYSKSCIKAYIYYY